MENEEGKNYSINWQSELVKFAIAGIFTLFDYFYLFLVRDLNLSIEEIISGTISITTENLKAMIVNNFSVLPLVVFWILVGVIAYLFYYSLEVLYYDIYLLSRSKKPVNPLADEEGRRTVRIGATRILAHFLVVILYVALVLSCYMFVVPLARISYLAITEINPFGFGFPMAFWGPILTWYATFSIIFYLYKRTTKSLHDEAYWEEHDLTI